MGFWEKGLKNMHCPSCKITGIILVVLLTIAGGYFLLAKTGQPPEALPATQAPATQATEIRVAGTEFSFKPASISVKAGEKVKIVFQNNGRAPHNLIIEGLGRGTKTIGAGQTTAVEFTAPSSGTYAFFCSVPGHRAGGMEGNLKVE